MTPTILDIEIVENYKIKLNYETGEVKLFDVSPYMNGAWYKELENEKYFNTVHIVSNGKGIAWEHGQDIAPHELYEMGIPINDIKSNTRKGMLKYMDSGIWEGNLNEMRATR